MKVKKLKIAFLSLYSGHVNRGAEVFVDELASKLAKTHEVVVYVGGNMDQKNKKYKVFSEKVKIKWNKKSGIGTLLHALFLDYWGLKVGQFTLGIIPKLYREKYDIVIPVSGGWMSFFTRLVTWLYGGKLVISGQSGVGWDDAVNLWCFPDMFIATSKKALNWAKKRNPFIKTTYIPNGVDMAKFSSGTKKFKHELKPPVVLAAGAFTRQKRMDLAIKAVSKIDASLLLVGSGELEGELTKLGNLLLKNRFKQISVSHEKMPEIYKSADVFTLPSHSSEAFGIVIVEAMACGLPVVVTNDPIRKEIIGKAGVLCDPVNSDVYAKALQKVILEKKEYSKHAVSQANKFNWSEISEKYTNVFKDLIK